jgi:sec-independent protein translocase protein TatA
MAAVGPFGLGPMELVIILLVLVMLFGATRLADLGGSLGKGIKEFRKEISAQDDDDKPANDGAPVASANGGGQETVAAVKCGSCGTLNPVGAKFCSSCGASIAAAVSTN